MVVCFFVCHRVVFRALSSLCVRRSVRECSTQHAYQETKQVTLERPISTQFKDDVLSSSQWLSVIKLQKSMTELVSLKQTKQKKAYDLGTCCLHQREWLYKAKQRRNATSVSQMCSSISWTANTSPSTTRGAIFACGSTETAGCSPPGSWSSRCRGSWTTPRHRSLERRSSELSLLEKGRRSVMKT